MDCFLFEGLSMSQKQRIFDKLSKPVTVTKGSELYKNGCLGILVSGNGTVKRIADDGHTVTVRTLLKDEVFGSASVFGNWKEGKSLITADCDCSVYYISEAVLKEIMSEHPAVAINYVSFLTDKIRFLNRRLDTFSAESTEQRIYEYFVSAADENGKIYVDFGMAELARRLKIGRTSLYRGLDALEKNGFIVRQKNIVTITEGVSL